MTRRVLIVDDEKQMVKTLCDIFRHRGWEADGAFSGPEAIDAVAQHAYSAVLMDIKMPSMNGVEALRAIRATNPQMRVVLMTAYSASDLIAQAIEEGALRVMSKPVLIPELLRFLDDSRNAAPVLVVDDDPHFLFTIADVLRGHGYNVNVALSLKDALRLLERKMTGVVVLDLRLGDQNPCDAVIAVREAHPAAVLILCSGYPQLLDETKQRIPAEWVHSRLQKPFSPEYLVELLDEIY
jgi:two-component system response regulator HydG